MSQHLRQLKRRLRSLEQRCITDGTLPVVVILHKEHEGQPLIVLHSLLRDGTPERVTRLLRNILADIDAGQTVVVGSEEPLAVVPKDRAPVPPSPLAGEGGGG